MIRRLILLIFLMSIPAFGIRAEEESQPPISVQAELSRAFITIGDPVEYTLTIRRNPKVQVLNRSLPLPSKEIVDIKKIEPFKKESDNQIMEGQRIQMTSYQLGEFVLDPLSIEYRTPSGDIGIIQTEPIYLTVRSVAEGEQKTDIRDIKSVLGIRFDRRILWIAAGAGALILMILAVWIFRKRRQIPQMDRESLLSPAEEALKAMNELYESDLIRKGRVKEYFFFLSEILKVFFERQYRILAVESTTTEILRSLKDTDLPGTVMQKIESVLETADLVKFAKWVPEPSQIVKTTKEARQIVEESESRKTDAV